MSRKSKKYGPNIPDRRFCYLPSAEVRELTRLEKDIHKYAERYRKHPELILRDGMVQQEYDPEVMDRLLKEPIYADMENDTVPIVLNCFKNILVITGIFADYVSGKHAWIYKNGG